MDALRHVINVIDGWVWGPVMIVLLVGTGLYLTVRLGLVQLLRFGHAYTPRRRCRGEHLRLDEGGKMSG